MANEDGPDSGKSNKTAAYTRKIVDVNDDNLDPKVIELRCDLCGLPCISLNQIRLHEELEHDLAPGRLGDAINRRDIPVQCFLCGKRLKSKYTLKTHIVKVHGTDLVHKCRHCGKIFTRHLLLAKHLRLAHYGENGINMTGEISGKLRLSTSSSSSSSSSSEMPSIPTSPPYFPLGASFNCAECRGSSFSDETAFLSHVSDVHKSDVATIFAAEEEEEERTLTEKQRAKEKFFLEAMCGAECLVRVSDRGGRLGLRILKDAKTMNDVGRKRSKKEAVGGKIVVTGQYAELEPSNPAACAQERSEDFETMGNLVSVEREDSLLLGEIISAWNDGTSAAIKRPEKTKSSLG